MDKKDDEMICDYMGKNAKDSKNADELWLYFTNVIDWIEAKFSKYRKEMKGLGWGLLYNAYKDKPLDKDELERRVEELMRDDEVQKKSGIYEYVLSGEEKHLNLRAFDKSIARAVYEEQGGICAECKEHFEIEEMQADHKKPWSKGGKTTKENCQMLCAKCNREKSDK